MEHVVWTQWSDLDLPRSIGVAPADQHLPNEEDLERITFYVPRYRGGPSAIDVVDRMPNLATLQLLTAGYEEASRVLREGLTLCNARGVHEDGTAELALGLTIAARRGFGHFAAAQAAGRWDHRKFAALSDSDVAVVGGGPVGRRIVDLLTPFSVSITLYSRSGRNAVPVARLGGQLGRHDIVVLAVPLTEETERMVDADFLAAMRPGALLVNVSRGRVVVTDALVEALQAGRIAAALDVTDPEPLPTGHPLWAAPNCLITPHIGGNTPGFEPRARRLVELQLRRIVEGGALLNTVP